MNTNRVRGWVPMLLFPLERVLELAAAIAITVVVGVAPAAAAITFVSSSTPTLKSTAVGSITLTAPAGIVAGDVLLAWMATSSSTQPDVATSPAGWTGGATQDPANRYGVAFYYMVASSADVAGTTTYNWTLSTAAPVAATIMAFRGVQNASPILDYNYQVSSAGVSHVAPSVTPGMANSMLVALYAVDNGNADTPSVPAGMTQIFQGATGNGSSGLLIESFFQAWVPATVTGTRTTNSGDSLSAAATGALIALQPGAVAAVPNHYAVSSAATAVNCAPAPVTITAHTSTHAVLATSDSILLGTSTGHGDWALTSGNGVFAAGASNSGAATYTYAAADDGVVTLALRDTFAEVVTVNVTDGSVTARSGTATTAEDSPLTFVASGFIVTNGSNVAAAIATQSAGLASVQSLALQAVRTDTASGACTSVFASGTTVSIGLAYQCNNPSACVAGQTLKITNNGTTTAISSNPNSGITTYVNAPLKFSTANAEAPITLVYSDAGQISLAEKYAIPLANGASSGNTMQGIAQFVVQPYTLQLSAIKNAGNVANPAASTAAGTVFSGAGQPFKATLTALNFLDAATPNFGQETTPAAVSLVPALVLPASGHNPAVTGTFGAYSGGIASGTAFAWTEAGIVTLTPLVTNYLGSGNISGTVSGNVGRFVPNNFVTATNIPIFATGCSSGSFTYLGQPFVYAVAPVLSVTAQAQGGTTTLNYSGALFRLTNASLTARAYTATPASPALNLVGLPATSSDPTIASLGSGRGSLTFSAGTGISFVRGSPVAPLTGNIALSINVLDLDGVSAANPVTFGTGSGIAFSTSALQYYGRLVLRSGLGSELLDLPLSLTTQYYLNGTQGFTPNTADVCTTAPGIVLSNYLENLSAGETCVRDSGSPGVSGAGCAAVSTTPYAATAVAGGFNLALAAPGAGNNGALTLTATPAAWLMYLWNAGSGSNSAPAGIATFGEFTGPASRVYQREVY
jgi:MSHA biogenesis protein MshQ